MRRGAVAVEEVPGGAWSSATITRAEEPNSCESQFAGSTATTAVEKATRCAEAGSTNGARIGGGMVWQHSRLGPCDEHGRVSQHCIASSGDVDASPQSTAKAARATLDAAIRIGLTMRIHFQLRLLLGRSQERWPPPAPELHMLSSYISGKHCLVQESMRVNEARHRKRSCKCVLLVEKLTEPNTSAG
jgi:hypothetical protein